MGQDVKTRCPSCGTLNRVPADRVGQTGRCGACGEELPAVPGGPVEVSDWDFHDVVLGSPVPVLLEFWSPSCGHCLRMNPVLEDVAARLMGRLTVAKMDVSSNTRTPMDYGIMGTPAFFVIKGGRIAEKFVGAMPGEDLMRKVERHL